MAGEELTRISFPLPTSVRHKLANVAFLLKMTEQTLVAEAIGAFLNAVVEKKGEKFKEALKLVEEAKDV